MHKFSFTPESLWSGPSAEAAALTSICSSMLNSGYKEEEPIVVRNTGGGPGSFGDILFGDGMKRGLAAKFLGCCGLCSGSFVFSPSCIVIT